MYMKKIILFTAIMGVFLTGCATEKTKGEENVESIQNSRDEAANTPLATKAFILETFQLTEEDIEKYDLEELISYFQLTEEYFLQVKQNLKDLSYITIDLKRLQKQMVKEKTEEKYDFSYLINAEKFSGEFPDMATIRYLTVSDQQGTGGTSFVIDFGKELIYDSYYSANLYSDIRRADKETVLKEEQKNDIIKALEEAEIWKWDYMYSDNSEPGMASWWHLGAEFEDGTIVSFNGAGIVPDNYSILEKVLYNR